MVEEFLRRFPERTDYRALACHAALPLALTPELLKYLRHEFLPHVSWVAEVDLLLSKLCDEAAEGVYVMKRDARAYLIRQMREDETLGELRIEAVNRILIERLDYLARNHLAILPHEWQTQRLSAMLYVTGQRDEAARALAAAIYQCVTGAAGEEGKSGAVATQTELARLTRLVLEEAANLRDDYPDLVRLAQLIGKILADRGRGIVEDLRASGQLSQTFKLPGVTVEAPLLEFLTAAQGATIARSPKTEERVETAGVPGAVQSSGFKYACYLNYHAGSAVSGDFVSRFQDALTRELSSGTEKSIFMASRKLESGPFYSEYLTRSLYESACYVVLWAPVDSGNESLERELESVRLLEERRFRMAGESLKNRGLILPVILRAQELAPESLRNIPWVDFSKAETSPRWFITKDTRNKIRSVAEFILDRCREAERTPEAFADPQDFALQVEAADLMRQAHSALNLGQYDKARANLERALKNHRDRQDRDGEILALNDLGECNYAIADFNQALRCYSEALEIARSVDARAHVAMLLDKLELLNAARSESEPALRSDQESLEISRELERDPLSPLVGQIRKKILGQSPKLLEMVEQVAKAILHKDSPALLIGEAGTGKELCARAIHELGPRPDAPFVAAQVSAIHEHLFESEMFGHEKGAFTDADRQHIGLFEQTGDGTLFLDEIGDLSASTQIRLLRVIHEKMFRRLNSEEGLPFNARLVCATSHNLPEEVRHKKFRLDLFRLISEETIYLPPLRERKGDIETLARHFLEAYKGERQMAFADETLRILQDYSFPGNVRELENIVKSALRACMGEIILPQHLPLQIMWAFLSPQTQTASQPAGTEEAPSANQRDKLTQKLLEELLRLLPANWLELGYRESLQPFRRAFDRLYLQYRLERARYNITRAAREAGLDSKTFRKLWKDCGSPPLSAGEEDPDEIMWAFLSPQTQTASQPAGTEEAPSVNQRDKLDQKLLEELLRLLPANWLELGYRESLQPYVRAFDRLYLRHRLERAPYDIRRAAREAGLDSKTFRKRWKDSGLPSLSAGEEGPDG